MHNGSTFAIYIDNDQLLLSKSHTIQFNGDEVDASYKKEDQIIQGNSITWETANINWESQNLTWEDSIGTDFGHFKEIIIGYKSANFSAEGLVVLDQILQTWDTTNYNWNLFNVNWEDGAIEPNASATLDDLIISGEEVKFEIISNNNYTIFSGRCQVNNYEMIANNDDILFYNADFTITGLVT